MLLPRLLIDNDIFILLAGANLLEQAVGTIGFALEETCRLEALSYIVRKHKKPSPLPPEIVERVIHACKTVPVLSEAPDLELVQSLTNTPTVDAGEALLYALLAEHPGYLLTSGDKRAMNAIAQIQALGLIRAAVAGRVICLETLLLKVLEQHDIADVARALAPVLPQNVTLRSIFTPNNIRKPALCLEGLSAYQQALIAQVGAGFLWLGI